MSSLPTTNAPPTEGTLHWRLSSHPLTLLTFLGFRISPLLSYLFGLLFTDNFVLVFILTTLLLSADFYYLKNIAGRRLVALRWWNEADPNNPGSTIWVFESGADTRQPNATDSRFFWMSLYLTPLLWIGLAVVAVLKLNFIWLSLVVIAIILGGINGLAFSRADKFGNAEGYMGGVMGSSIGRRVVGGAIGGTVGRIFGR
ncbi:DUF846-domain-containing protein [Ascobolus immersus RN42]|uniref:Golgi apparatus membrane protein TVP23 n=1 Tax=Ascobolus immersus RN42 TaxID=1160509 RepID=A0A3N4IVH1_ASCIM|nr:DUF846-domain-containing protein [Ascobolus immersus RN42]